MNRTHPVVVRSSAWLRRLGQAPDLPLIAAASLGSLGLAQAAVSATGNGWDGSSGEVATALALALGSTVPLAFVRGQLVAAAAAITSAVLLAPLGGWLPTVAGVIALAAVLHLVGLRATPPVALLFAVPFVAYAVGADAGQPPDAGAAAGAAEPGGRPLAVGLLVGACAMLALGAARRSRRESASRTVADWAYADTLLQNAARGERARIARELHDIVAHHISSLSVQAETARLTTPGLPPEGAAKLLAIGETARQALTEMRRLLGVLREDVHEPSTRRPQPGLDQLLTLVDRARDTSGTVVRLTVSGRIRPVDPGTELAAYRIVQEALTNSRRHAPGAAVDIELHYGQDTLRISVRDSGTGGAPGPTGHGLLGMRERAAMAGGTLTAGPGPTAGFHVEARLPVAPSPGVPAAEPVKAP